MKGEFASEDGAIELEERLEKFQRLWRGDRHLRGRVNFHIRRDLLRELCEAEILNNQRIDARVIDGAKLILGGLKLVRKNQRVHGHEPLHAVVVKKFHQLGQVFEGEIIGAKAGVKLRQTEENRVCSCGDGGAGAIPVASGAEEFGSRGGVVHARTLGWGMICWKEFLSLSGCGNFGVGV